MLPQAWAGFATIQEVPTHSSSTDPGRKETEHAQSGSPSNEKVMPATNSRDRENEGEKTLPLCCGLIEKVLLDRGQDKQTTTTTTIKVATYRF